MDKRIVRAAAVVALVSLAACGPDKAPARTGETRHPATPATTQTDRPAATVRSGSYCRQAGASAQTDAGRPMVCATTGTDKRLRWRAR